jgi:enoyl-[acyl-carrier protein] reductase I
MTNSSHPPADYMELSGKIFLVTGVHNKKSIAHFVATELVKLGAEVIFSLQDESKSEIIEKNFPGSPYFICDVAKPSDIENLAVEIKKKGLLLSGFIHSMAWAPFQNPPLPYHETSVTDFIQAATISSFSLGQLAGALNKHQCLALDASVVTLSISNTKIASYGMLGPIKAHLESSCAYLAQSFSQFSQVRFNAISAGPLKTSASAGIPGYIDHYLYAEALTLRKKALTTLEVAKSVIFLLSPISSGINATNIVVDLGMSCNYFDNEVVQSHAKRTLKI